MLKSPEQDRCLSIQKINGGFQKFSMRRGGDFSTEYIICKYMK